MYVNTNVEEVSPIIANSKIFQRAATGATKITSSAVTTQLSSQAYAFNMQESKANQQALDAMKTISVTATGASSDADVIAGAINAAGFQNITAIVDSSNKIQISHKLGGEIRIKDTDGGLALIGFAVYNFANGTGTANLYTCLLYTSDAADE